MKLPEENPNTPSSAWISFTICSTRKSFITGNMDEIGMTLCHSLSQRK